MLRESGGADRDRTDDLDSAIVALYQLSYSPVKDPPHHAHTPRASEIPLARITLINCAHDPNAGNTGLPPGSPTPPPLLPMRILSLLLLPALLALPLQAQVPGTSWERLTDDEAAAAGWSRVELAQAQAFSQTLQTEAVMIVTRGKILESWGPIERKFNVHSIRKSFISAMIGIRAAEGKIRLDATMGELGIDDRSPRLSAAEKQATVLHLLQARSGVYHPAQYETAAMKARRPPRHSHAQGTPLYYNNWDIYPL